MRKLHSIAFAILQLDFVIVQYISQSRKNLAFAVDFVVYLYSDLQILDLEEIRYYSKFGCYDKSRCLKSRFNFKSTNVEHEFLQYPSQH